MIILHIIHLLLRGHHSGSSVTPTLCRFSITTSILQLFIKYMATGQLNCLFSIRMIKVSPPKYHKNRAFTVLQSSWTFSSLFNLLLPRLLLLALDVHLSVLLSQSPFSAERIFSHITDLLSSLHWFPVKFINIWSSTWTGPCFFY